MLEGKVIVVRKKAGEENRLFGSVTNTDVAAALEQLGITVEKKYITLPDAIKTIGEYKVPIKTGFQTTAYVLLQVVAETVGGQQ